MGQTFAAEAVCFAVAGAPEFRLAVLRANVRGSNGKGHVEGRCNDCLQGEAKKLLLTDADAARAGWRWRRPRARNVVDNDGQARGGCWDSASARSRPSRW